MAFQVCKFTEAWVDIYYAALCDTLRVTFSELAKWQSTTNRHIFIKRKMVKEGRHPLQIYSSQELYFILVANTSTYLLCTFLLAFES